MSMAFKMIYKRDAEKQIEAKSMQLFPLYSHMGQNRILGNCKWERADEKTLFTRGVENGSHMWVYISIDADGKNRMRIFDIVAYCESEQWRQWQQELRTISLTFISFWFAFSNWMSTGKYFSELIETDKHTLAENV